MNKNILFLIIVFIFVPLLAMRKEIDNMPRIVGCEEASKEFNGDDLSNINEIPQEWKQMNFKALIATRMQPKALDWKKVVFFTHQLGRYNSSWNYINYLQEQHPKKVYVTINQAFIAKHKRAFLYCDFTQMDYKGINALVERVKSVKASLEKKVKIKGAKESHE